MDLHVASSTMSAATFDLLAVFAKHLDHKIKYGTHTWYLCEERDCKKVKGLNDIVEGIVKAKGDTKIVSVPTYVPTMMHGVFLP